MTLGVWKIMEITQGTLLAGLILMVSRTVALNCEERITEAARKINSYATHDDHLYFLVPYIQANNDLNDFCDVYPDVRNELKKLLEDCKGSGDIKVYLSKMAGFDYMCNDGYGDYEIHSKCIFEMSTKLEESCPTQYRTLNAIRRASVFPDDTKPDVCGEIKNYMQCSSDLITKGCKDNSAAGHWYRSFLKSVFNYMADNKQLHCSFGGTAGLLKSSATNIALFVGCGVLVLLILFCICWCCRAKVCSRCNPTDERDVEYHRPGRNDKELSRVNSVV